MDKSNAAVIFGVAFVWTLFVSPAIRAEWAKGLSRADWLGDGRGPSMASQPAGWLGAKYGSCATSIAKRLTHPWGFVEFAEAISRCVFTLGLSACQSGCDLKTIPMKKLRTPCSQGASISLRAPWSGLDAVLRDAANHPMDNNYSERLIAIRRWSEEL